MDNNFSPQVKEVISFSREEALRLGNDFIGTEHLLLGLIRDGNNLALKVLMNLHVDLAELRKEVELAIKDKNGKTVVNMNSLPLTKQAEKVIRVTVLEAKSLKSPVVETEHLLLSILKNKDNIATQILNQFDIGLKHHFDCRWCELCFEAKWHKKKNLLPVICLVAKL